MGILAKKAINKAENPMIPSDKFNPRNIMEIFIESFYNMKPKRIIKEAAEILLEKAKQLEESI